MLEMQNTEISTDAAQVQSGNEFPSRQVASADDGTTQFVDNNTNAEQSSSISRSTADESRQTSVDNLAYPEDVNSHCVNDEIGASSAASGVSSSSVATGNKSSNLSNTSSTGKNNVTLDGSSDESKFSVSGARYRKRGVKPYELDNDKFSNFLANLTIAEGGLEDEVEDWDKVKKFMDRFKSTNIEVDVLKKELKVSLYIVICCIRMKSKVEDSGFLYR